MNSFVQVRRVAAVLMLGAFATTMVAPLAEAGNGRGRGHGRRYKNVQVVREVHRSYPAYPYRRVTYVRRQSNAGPILAGVVGGLILGSVLSNSNVHASVHADYSYYDPYCETSYRSLERYRSHSRGCDHPQVVRVIEVSNGNHVRDMCWRDNGWREYKGDWRNDGGYDRHGDDGYRYRDDDRRYKEDRDWDDD